MLNLRFRAAAGLFGDGGAAKSSHLKWGIDKPYLTYFPKTGKASKIHGSIDAIGGYRKRYEHDIKKYKF